MTQEQNNNLAVGIAMEDIKEGQLCSFNPQSGELKVASKQDQTPTPSDTFIEDMIEKIRIIIRDNLIWYKDNGEDHGDLVLAEETIKEKVKSSLQEQLNQFKEMITEYDEIYINEEVRQAINRMKWKLTDLLK